MQQCSTGNIAVGGGSLDANESFRSVPSEPEKIMNDFDWGAGLLIEDDLLQGFSSPCLTYGSPSLSKFHEVGSPFEIINVELWTSSPCMSFDEAEKLELGRLLSKSTPYAFEEQWPIFSLFCTKQSLLLRP